MPKSVSVFPSELTDDVQRKLAEYFTTTASFLAGCSGGIRGEKQVKTDKEAVEEGLSAPPFQNCERHRRVNKPPADCRPLINTLFGSHGAGCRKREKGRCVPRNAAPETCDNKLHRKHNTQECRARSPLNAAFTPHRMMWTAANFCLAHNNENMQTRWRNRTLAVSAHV